MIYPIVKYGNPVLEKRGDDKQCQVRHHSTSTMDTPVH